jgi:glycosyltransferase involved in cell wall biosynthesis
MLCELTRAAARRGWRTQTVFDESARDRAWVEDLVAAGAATAFVPARSFAAKRDAIGRLLAEESGPVVLHTHFTSFDVPAALAGRGKGRVSVFWHIHSRARPEATVVARNVVKYAVVGRAVDRILCVAPDIAEAVRRRGAPRRRVQFVANAIDTARFPPVGDAERAAARGRLGLPPEARVLLHFGWDWHRKGGDVFLEAVRLLADEPVLGLTVGAPEEAREERRRLGLDEAIVIAEPTDDVRTLYAAADVLVASSRAEGMPYAVTEALSSGLPVVATTIPGHTVQADGLAACRLVPLDAGEIAGAVRSFLHRDAAAAAREAQAAHDRIRERMSLEGWSERMLDLYERTSTTARP